MSASGFAAGHRSDALSGAALTYGYQVALYVFAAVTAFAAIPLALMLESKPARTELAATADGAAEPGVA
jgi:hypothetical protein